VPDFLVMHYPECDFLCSRDDIVASTIRIVQDGLVQFGTQLLQEFDLAGYVHQVFPQLSTQPTDLALVCRTDRLFPARPTQSANGLMALRVGSESYVATHPFADFRLFPFTLRQKLRRHGLLGTRFDGQRVQYLLDLALFLSNFETSLAVAS
jgi:hypothetical protein